MILLIISILAFVLYGSLIFFFLHHWRGLSEYRPATKGRAQHFISVVVAARNEEKYIGSLLNALKDQSYPASFFEVIVVDDFSTDGTATAVNGHPLSNIALIRPALPANASSKKPAILAGIQKARGTIIVTTDADCIPGQNWLQTLHDFFIEKNAVFVAAPVKFTHNKDLLQVFQSLDFLTLQGITAAAVASGSLTMCNGANLAYTKKAFEEVNGFEGIDKVATGDDMLLMHKIWKQNREKVFYLKSREAIVTTQPMFSWREFFMQRKRWASKTFVYDDHRIIAVLAFVFLFNLLFFVLLAAAFIEPVYWIYALVYLLIKTMIEWPFVSFVSRFYGERLMKHFILLQPFHIFYTVFMGIAGQTGRYEWKGRRTK